MAHSSNTTIIELHTCGYGSGAEGMGWMWVDLSRLIFKFERGSFEETQNFKSVT